MRHVILGASAAGLTAAGELRRLDPAADITVVSTDTEVYSRCMLHRRLAGDREDISFVPADFFAANRIRWLPGETAIDLDLDAGAVLLA
ncbi:MAG: FAD-dependent oxidoreductase, partial [Planctomycetes bacterium]|nr:FAD-dependent oxidoreductase [Planctomycetota bacterium]